MLTAGTEVQGSAGYAPRSKELTVLEPGHAEASSYSTAQSDAEVRPYRNTTAVPGLGSEELTGIPLEATGDH